MKSWTTEMEEQLREMTERGISPTTIAKRLGVTLGAAVHKATRMHLELYTEYHSHELTAPDISRVTGSSIRTVHRWMDAELLNYVRRGARKYVKQDELIRFLYENPDKWIPDRADKVFLEAYGYSGKPAPTRYSKLWSDRDADVCARMIAQGYMAKEIAAELNRSVTAVEKFIYRRGLRNKENNKWIGRV